MTSDSTRRSGDQNPFAAHEIHVKIETMIITNETKDGVGDDEEEEDEEQEAEEEEVGEERLEQEEEEGAGDGNGRREERMSAQRFQQRHDRLMAVVCE